MKITRLIKKCMAATLLSAIILSAAAPMVQGSVRTTNIIGSKQPNSYNTKWRSHTRICAYEDAGHLFNLKVVSKIGNAISSNTTTVGSLTVNSGYVSDKNAHAWHEYYIGNVLKKAWQED
ncbi:MAG: hypothetical protein E7265_09695 [Lachnospiraceae bacterium]|nr:hypothetical protein [Lachnospiraceae bacterium]